MRVQGDRMSGVKARPNSVPASAMLAAAVVLCAINCVPEAGIASEAAGVVEPQAVLAPDNASGSSVRPAVAIAQAGRRSALESRRPEVAGDGERERLMRLIIL